MKRIVYGEHTYGAIRLVESDMGDEIRFGKFCSLASNIVITLGGNHRVDWFTTFPLGNRGVVPDCPPGVVKSGGPVIVGNDVWIAQDVTIYGGSTIGDGAVIGSRSVLRGYIPPYALAYGNPCVVQRMRFSEEVIRFLLELKWWDWEIKKIKKYALVLQSGNIEELMKIE